MRFDSELTITGPWRAPAQMLAEQEVDGHTSVHDESTASSLGLAGAPIEGPTHFSQFDPIGVALWGDEWFRTGCISSHFQNMVVEGEEVQASFSLGPSTERHARIAAHKRDGTPVLIGTASVGDASERSELRVRLARTPPDPGPLHIIDRLTVGARVAGDAVRIPRHERNGHMYPFSLEEKLARITEPHPWYTEDGGPKSPWGRAIVPMEMISVLTHKHKPEWPVRSPAIGLFLDLEVRLEDGPVFVDQDYVLEHEIVALSQSRRTESYWTSTAVVDAATRRRVATVVLHQGVFKDSYPGYPER